MYCYVQDYVDYTRCDLWLYPIHRLWQKRDFLWQISFTYLKKPDFKYILVTVCHIILVTFFVRKSHIFYRLLILAYFYSMYNKQLKIRGIMYVWPLSLPNDWYILNKYIISCQFSHKFLSKTLSYKVEMSKVPLQLRHWRKNCDEPGAVKTAF